MRVLLRNILPKTSASNGLIIEMDYVPRVGEDIVMSTGGDHYLVGPVTKVMHLYDVFAYQGVTVFFEGEEKYEEEP